MEHLKDLPFPKSYSDLMGKNWEEPYFPQEHLQTIGNKGLRLTWVQNQWLKANNATRNKETGFINK